MRRSLHALCALLLIASCSTSTGPIVNPDGGPPDAGLPNDGGIPDSGLPDAGVPDSGMPDSGLPDAGPLATIDGTIVDGSGAPISGVQVATSGLSTTSAADGTFTLSLSASGSPILLFTLDGYLDGCKTVTVASGQTTNVAVLMLPRSVAQPLDATSGGTITGPAGSSLTVPANALVDQSGNAVTGTVQVALTPLDPTNPTELAAYPGTLMATRTDGTVVPLHTWGVLDIDVRQNGQKLQVASGQTLTATIPAASPSALPSDSILWSFDASTGLWKEEGTTSQAGSSGIFSAQLPHLSMWNVDDAFESGSAGCISGQVVDAQGNPVFNATVEALDPNLNQLESAATTDADGKFCLLTLAGSFTQVTATKGNLHATDNTQSGGPESQVGALCSPTSCGQANFTLGAAADGGIVGAGVSCDLGSAGDGGAGDGGSALTDPFLGTCAEPIFQFFACFQPNGGCTSQLNTATDAYEFDYSNGSKQIISVLSSSSETIDFYGPGGASCGSEQLIASSDSIDFILNDRVFVTSRTMVICPDGGAVPVPQSGDDLVKDCGGLGLPEAFDGGSCPAFGTPGAACSSDADCGGTFQTSCCFATAGNVCLPSAECSLYQTMGCSQALMSCPGGFCCPVDGLNVNLCIPELTSCSM